MNVVSPAAKPERPVDWRSLLAYVQALEDFTRAAPAELTPHSFDRLKAAPPLETPPAQVFVAADGCKLAYRVYPARESRQMVVLVHGSAGFGDQMQLMAHRLAASNVATAYTIDMRGHGLSEGRRGHAVRHAWQLTDDLGRFVQHVHDADPQSKICLAGHSAGGGLVLGLSRTAGGQLIDSYLFLAPFLGLGCPANRPYFGGWVTLRALALRALTLANLFGFESFNDGTVVDFAIKGAADPRYVASWSYNTMLAFGPGRWRPDAAPITPDKPVLVLAGEKDECFDVSCYPAAFERVAPHARIRTTGPIGHWDLLVSEQATEEVAFWLADSALEDLKRFTVPPAQQQAAARLTA